MKLVHPLAGLVDRGQTICVPECCGIDAYDFSPIHVASFLVMWRGDVDQSELSKLRQQIESLRDDFGSNGRLGNSVSIEGMNLSMTGTEVDAFASELSASIESALKIIATQARSKNGETLEQCGQARSPGILRKPECLLSPTKSMDESGQGGEDRSSQAPFIPTRPRSDPCYRRSRARLSVQWLPSSRN